MISDALLAFIENQAHRRARPGVLLNLIIFFLKIQKANVFLNSFILHRTGEILYAYAEAACHLVLPPAPQACPNKPSGAKSPEQKWLSK